MRKYLLLIVLATLLAACGKQAAPTAKEERPAATIVVGSGAVDEGNVYSGEVHAQHEAVLGFRISGKIVERLVDAGTMVRKGQVLARLDASDSRLQESAATAQYRMAEDELNRYRELRDRNFVSQSALDAKETALKAAAAQAGLARNQEAYTSLVSDRHGVVTGTFAEVGQVVVAGQAVVRIAQQGEREVVISVPETRYPSIKVGMSAEIELAAASNNTQSKMRGYVREIVPAADSASHTYPVRVSFVSGDPKVALGMTARVRLNESKGNSAQRANSYLIPLTSLFQQGKSSAVWIVAADRSVSLRPVVVAEYRDDGVLIASGIAAGERIVSAGVHKLSAGERIQIIEDGKLL